MFYFDPYYLILVVPALLLSMWASARVNSTYNKYSQVRSARNITGADAARAILDANGLGGIRIERVRGNLTDHYDPKAKVIRLSDSVHDNPSIAAVGVAAHECGHAIQHKESYAPIKLRNAIAPVASIGSNAGPWLAILGIIFGSNTLAWIGIWLFAGAVAFYMITLPVEFNASSRALRILDSRGILGTEELMSTKKVLSAAAMTYVASALVSVANLLRLVLLVGGRRRND